MEFYVLDIFCIMILFSLKVDAQDEPQITKNILPEIKRYGTTGRLNCTVTLRQTNYKVHWRRKGTDFNTDILISANDKITANINPIVDLGNRKYDIEKIEHSADVVTYQLVVRRLSIQDAGIYTCLIQITGGSSTRNPSKDGELIVLIPPSISQLGTTQTVNAQEGFNTTLQCSASGFPKPNITWVRPNGLTLPFPNSEKFSVRSNALQMFDLKKTDRGVYRCIADNNVRPPDMYDVTLYVQFAPSARAVQTTYGQAQNRMFDVTIECRVAGYPAPNLMWYKKIADGLSPINDNDKFNIHVLLSHGQTLSLAEFWYQLTIINVQANDYGDYICEGANDLGSDQAVVNLYETSECQGAWCPYQTGNPSGATGHLCQLPVYLLVVLHSFLNHMAL